jgi:hypothetical protein
MVENFSSRPSIVSKISLAALFQGRQPVQPTTAYSSRNWSTGSHRRPVDRTFVANRGSIGEASGNVIPTRKYREVLVTFSLAGVVGTEELPPGALSTIPPHAVRTALASEVSLLP